MLETLAMLLIGDGVLGVADPRRHVLLWQRGPRLWQSALEPFAHHPLLTRCVGAAAIGAGLWLARRQGPPFSR